MPALADCDNCVVNGGGIEQQTFHSCCRFDGKSADRKQNGKEREKSLQHSDHLSDAFAAEGSRRIIGGTALDPKIVSFMFIVQTDGEIAAFH